MAGKLVQVATNTVTSAVASVSLVGINTDDVYMVAVSNLVPATDDARTQVRTTTSGTADSDSEYDYAYKNLKTSTTFGNSYATNQTRWDLQEIGNATGETNNMILYLYNFNSSSEYSFITVEQAFLTNGAELRGHQGGGVHTVAETNDGVDFSFDSGNITSGVFTMYKVL